MTGPHPLPVCHQDIGRKAETILDTKIITKKDTGHQLPSLHNFMTKTYGPGHWTIRFERDLLIFNATKCLNRGHCDKTKGNTSPSQDMKPGNEIEAADWEIFREWLK